MNKKVFDFLGDFAALREIKVWGLRPRQWSHARSLRLLKTPRHKEKHEKKGFRLSWRLCGFA
jgi:hypothetical protein